MLTIYHAAGEGVILKLRTPQLCIELGNAGRLVEEELPVLADQPSPRGRRSAATSALCRDPLRAWRPPPTLDHRRIPAQGVKNLHAETLPPRRWRRALLPSYGSGISAPDSTRLPNSGWLTKALRRSSSRPYRRCCSAVRAATVAESASRPAMRSL
jgi:hypothetical protein